MSIVRRQIAVFLFGWLCAAPAVAQHKASWPALDAAVSAGGGERDAAVIAAIERYAFVAPVAGARQNATDWYNHLVQGRSVPLDAVKLLRDEAATKEKLLRFARQAAAKVQPGGTLWLIFIGHGAPGRDGKDAVLVGVDAQQDADSLYERSVLRSELLGIAASSRAARVVAVLDTCFSGRSSAGKPLIAGLQPLVVTGPPAGLDPRVLLFTAAKGNEFAGPLPGAERPSFSYLMLGGLRGWADARDAGGDGNGVVTAKELHAYTQRALSSLLTDRTQTPTFEGEGAATLGAAREKGPNLAAIIARATTTAIGASTAGGPTVGLTRRASDSHWTASPQFGPSIIYSYGNSRTLFGVGADIMRRSSETFAWGLLFGGGFGAGFISADVGPQFRWSFLLGQAGSHAPYVRLGFPFRFFQIAGATDQFTGETAPNKQVYGVGTALFGGGYRYFVSKNVGVGIDLAFIPTLLISASDESLSGVDFAFGFNLSFGVEIRL